MPTEWTQEQTSLGIELGSTRIKAILLSPDLTILAQGSVGWESRLEHGYWTYSLDQVWSGLQAAYAALKADFEQRHLQPLVRVGVIGVSAMMHGFLPFDQDGALLTPFRTWRNTNTPRASRELSALFGCNIPLRWSIAHLDQAILDKEPYLPSLDYLTTLAGYVHWKLTGLRVLGIGDASGMFPVDSGACDYDAARLAQYEARIAPKGYPWTLRDVLPQVLTAGTPAGYLTPEGAQLLDPSGALTPGAVFAPPEGDAGTGMTATNAVRPRTGNVSAGTSIFSMVVLERPLAGSDPEIDLVMTPDGHPVAMVHCNNATSDLNAWVQLFQQTLALFGQEVSKQTLYTTLFQHSLEGAADCGGTLSYNLTAGEPIIGVQNSLPLVLHRPDRAMLLPDFLRAQIYACFASLCLGMTRLEKAQVICDRMTGHGGLFTTPGVAQRYLASALGIPIAVMPTAQSGGAYGMALLGMYLQKKQAGIGLADYLEQDVFSRQQQVWMQPEQDLRAGFDRYLRRYAQLLPAIRQMSELNDWSN